MKPDREKLREEFLAEAGELFDELMDWDDETEAPNMTQIEDMVLELRKRFGQRVVEKIILRQEVRQPAERVMCPQCGEEMEPKGPKGNRVETRIGDLKIERAHYYCRRCKQGFFPPGPTADAMGETLE